MPSRQMKRDAEKLRDEFRRLAQELDDNYRKSIKTKLAGCITEYAGAVPAVLLSLAFSPAIPVLGVALAVSLSGRLVTASKQITTDNDIQRILKEAGEKLKLFIATFQQEFQHLSSSETSKIKRDEVLQQMRSIDKAKEKGAAALISAFWFEPSFIQLLHNSSELYRIEKRGQKSKAGDTLRAWADLLQDLIDGEPGTMQCSFL